MSVSLTEKITVAEAHEWLKNACLEWGLSHHETETFVEDITGFRPRDFQAPKAKRGPNKNSLSLDERRCLPYDPTRCDAGVYVGPGGKPGPGGHWVQCKCKADGLCKTHQKVVDKHGMPRDGFFNQERPTHPFNDETQKPTPWEGVEVPTRRRSQQSSGGERKATTCSHCGEVGHNIRTCPNLDQEAKNPEKKAKKSLEDEKADLLKKLAVLEKKQEDTVEDKPVDTTETESTEVCPDGLDCGINQCPLEHQPEPEPEPQSTLARAPSQPDLTNSELEEDTSEYQAADADDETITVEDEADETIDCSFEGVEYVRDNSGTVFDMPEMDAVGTWDEDNNCIIFEKHALKAHKKMRDPKYN